MDSFFSSVLRTKNTVLNREQLIKQTILDTLSDNVKEIQYELKEDEDENITKGGTAFVIVYIYVIAVLVVTAV